MEDNFKDDTFLARWLSGQLSDEELAEFESHKDFETYKKIASASANLQVPERNKQKGWEALSQVMTEKDSPPLKKPATKQRTISWWKYAAAASILFIIGYFVFSNNDSLQTYNAAVASQETISLPDGSTVILNADSEISFKQKGFLAERTLNLSGEAFFSVKKGSNFTVETQNGAVRVLGTSFNVNSRKNKIDIKCYTGKVGLSFNEFKEMEVLNPGDRVLAQNQQLIQRSKSEINDTNPSWTKGQSKFEQADFIEVIESLERQFDVTISYPQDLKKLPKYNGGFPHNNLETALNIIFSSVGYQYEINGKQIKLVKSTKE